MARGRHAALVVLLATCGLLATLALPALAQQPYPPPPPPGGPPAHAEAECSIRPPRTLACSGEAYLAGSTVTIEIRASRRGRLVAADTVPVRPDGTFDHERALGCEVEAERIRVRVSGRDANDRPSTHMFNFRIGPPPSSCTQVAADVREPGPAGQAAGDRPGRAGAEGSDRSSGAPGSRGSGGQSNLDGASTSTRTAPAGGFSVRAAVDTYPDGSVAVTGRNLLSLLALALLLATASAVGVRARRQGGLAS